MVDNKFMENNTAQQILDIAQKIVRNRGYSAFSYADISEQIGIRKASIHYHFPAKDELVRQLVRRYRENMALTCDRIARSKSTFRQRLLEFVALYREGLEDGQICLCSMLTADFSVLTPAIQEELHLYFQETEGWLSALLQRGYQLNTQLANLEAKGLIAILQGAQLIARTHEDSTKAFDQLLLPLLERKFPEQ
jgi:TetR/AcrR family transcriptional regulator, transcriptional repressor for nem operon